MANYKEIVTKAILGKGKKTFTHKNSIETKNKPTTVLGCWVINHLLVVGDKCCKIYQCWFSVVIYFVELKEKND